MDSCVWLQWQDARRCVIRFLRVQQYQITFPLRSENRGTGPVEEWVLLKNDLLLAVILSFCFLSCGDKYVLRQGGK